MAESQQKVLLLGAEINARNVANQKEMVAHYTSLCPNNVIDDRGGLMFKDSILNLASSSTQAQSSGTPQLTNQALLGDAHKPLTISTVALELGIHLNTVDQQSIGRKVAAAYKLKYRVEPTKLEQFVGGAVVRVNSYTNQDLELVQTTIKNFVKPKTSQPSISFAVLGPAQD